VLFFDDLDAAAQGRARSTLPCLAGLDRFKEAWPKDQRAFPTLARHGLGRGQIGSSAWLIVGLERWRGGWDVVRVSPAGRQAKRVAPTR
jgi:hypothetical protein